MEHSDHVTDVDDATLPQPGSPSSDIPSTSSAVIGEVTNWIVASFQHGGTTAYSTQDKERTLDSSVEDKQPLSPGLLVNKAENAFFGDCITSGLKVGANEMAIQATESIAADDSKAILLCSEGWTVPQIS